MLLRDAGMLQPVRGAAAAAAAAVAAAATTAAAAAAAAAVAPSDRFLQQGRKETPIS